MTNVNWAATLILFISALSCIFLANYSSYKMLRKVNSDLPASVRSTRSWFDSNADSADDPAARSNKNPKSARRARRFLRAGIPRVKSRALLLMAIGSALACAWQLGFFDFLLSK
jgi:hypothetical protein